MILAIPTLHRRGSFVQPCARPERYGNAKETQIWNDPAVEDAITVNVTGKRFFWVFEYPEYGIVTANELVFPASKAVRLNLRTEDVIHSFWLPKLAGKMDLMPGQENFIWFVADQKKLLYKTDKDGRKTPASITEAMPAVHDGSLERLCSRIVRSSTNSTPWADCFTGNAPSTAAILMPTCNFEPWLRRMQTSTNGWDGFRIPKTPRNNLKLYDPEKEYATGDRRSCRLIPTLGEGAYSVNGRPK